MSPESAHFMRYMYDNHAYKSIIELLSVMDDFNSYI